MDRSFQPFTTSSRSPCLVLPPGFPRPIPFPKETISHSRSNSGGRSNSGNTILYYQHKIVIVSPELHVAEAGLLASLLPDNPAILGSIVGA